MYLHKRFLILCTRCYKDGLYDMSFDSLCSCHNQKYVLLLTLWNYMISEKKLWKLIPRWSRSSHVLYIYFSTVSLSLFCIWKYHVTNGTFKFFQSIFFEIILQGFFFLSVFLQWIFNDLLRSQDTFNCSASSFKRRNVYLLW